MNRDRSEADVVLVTGASSGFGAVTAKRFAALGFRTFGTSRSGNDGPQGVEMLALDVHDDASVQSCVAELSRRTGRIDILVNNAGRAMLGACEETSAAEARELFDTNVFGVMRMVSAVLPLMRAQNRGRIVNVGSLSGFIGVPFHGVYAASKHALAGYSEALRAEVEPYGIWVSLVEPAAHRTGIKMIEPRGALALYDDGRRRVERIIRAQIESGDDPARVADVIVRAATSTRPAFRYRVGRKATFAAWARRLLSINVFEWLVRREFQMGSGVRKNA